MATRDCINQGWYLDSSATKLMTQDRGVFDYTHKVHENVLMANGESINEVGIG